MRLKTFLMAMALLATGTLCARNLSFEDFIRIRCSFDPDEETIYFWQGSVYSNVPEQKHRKLFKIVGMNIARCQETPNRTWRLLTRELNYYLDPNTGERIDRWKNPWTKENLPVMHVANDPIQSIFYPFKPESETQADGTASLLIHVSLEYPNPLFAEEKFRPYAPYKSYRAVELFNFDTKISKLEIAEESRLASLQDVRINWSRIGPWLPWMKMGDTKGNLVYSATGGRLNSIENLPPLLRSEIQERLPRYAHAPSEWQNRANETSWTNFARYFPSYQKGERFPLAAN